MTELNLEDGTYKSKLIINDCEKTNLIGLCTGWDVAENYKDTGIDIIGTLYTKIGALIVLRNLLLNPKIKMLMILDTNPLGQNNVGNKGLQLLHEIFIDSNTSIVPYDLDDLLRNIIVVYITNDNISIRKQNIVETIENNCKNIHDIIKNILHITSDEMLGLITRKKLVYLPDKVEQMTYIPNEYIGESIRGENIFDAWFQTLAHVSKYGHPNGDLHEYHSIHWNFPIDNMMKVIDDYKKIITQPDVQQMFGLDENSLKDYSKTMNENIIIPTSAYTYGNRLQVYKERIQKNLKENIRTRYAFGTTLQYDKEDKQAPCLIYIQLLYDTVNERMNLYAIFRAHDMFKASFANAFALGEMLDGYCVRNNIKPGRVEITSISAHIYKTDLGNVKLFLNCLREHVGNIIHYDPRGNLIITKKGDIFDCELREPKENKLVSIISGTNTEIYKKILHEKIITDPEHLEYIFEQLFM